MVFFSLVSSFVVVAGDAVVSVGLLVCEVPVVVGYCLVFLAG